MKKKWILLIFVLGGSVALAWIGISHNQRDIPMVLSFEDCIKAGYSVVESSPRQCKTPDGRIYAEEIAVQPTYVNASSDLIKINTPYPGAVTGKEFSVMGQVRGMWFFEASFPIELVDKDGKVLTTGIAHAQSDWMTEDFVSFKTDIQVPESYSGEATLVLKKDNPSGLTDKNASVSFPITIEY